MNVREIAKEFRRRHGDELEPYLWTDPELILWINEAQEMYCRLTDGIPDTITLTAAEGIAFSAYSPAVKTFRNLWDSQGQPIPVWNMEDLARGGSHGMGATDSVAAPLPRINDERGPIRGAIIGMRMNELRWWMVPAEDQDISAHVFRLPLERLCRAEQEPEIQPHHHLLLLDWVGYRAHMKQDAETFDRSRSAEFQEQFINQCELVKSEQSRIRHRPSLVQYGGL